MQNFRVISVRNKYVYNFVNSSNYSQHIYTLNENINSYKFYHITSSKQKPTLILIKNDHALCLTFYGLPNTQNCSQCDAIKEKVIILVR